MHAAPSIGVQPSYRYILANTISPFKLTKNRALIMILIYQWIGSVVDCLDRAPPRANRSVRCYLNTKIIDIFSDACKCKEQDQVEASWLAKVQCLGLPSQRAELHRQRFQVLCPEYLLRSRFLLLVLRRRLLQPRAACASSTSSSCSSSLGRRCQTPATQRHPHRVRRTPPFPLEPPSFY